MEQKNKSKNGNVHKCPIVCPMNGNPCTEHTEKMHVFRNNKGEMCGNAPLDEEDEFWKKLKESETKSHYSVFDELVFEIKNDAQRLLAFVEDRERKAVSPVTVESGRAEFESVSEKLKEMGYTFRGAEYWYDNIPLFAFENDVGKFVKELSIRGNSGKIQIDTRIGHK